MEAVNEINMDGFQVVSSDYFNTITRINLPTLTIWDGSVGFSRQNIIMLNSCENVLVKINAKEEKILVIPSNSSDKDAIKWIKKKNPIEGRKLACMKLTDQLYSQWNWDKDFIYRAVGRLVTSNNKVMLIFDFSTAEKWKRPEAKHVE